MPTRTTSAPCRTSSPSSRACPVYASTLARGLLGNKIKEHKLHNNPLIALEPGDEIDIGAFHVMPVPGRPLDPGRDGHRPADAGRDDRPHRRLQVRPHAGRRQAVRLRELCYSPAFTSTSGDSPAALGNRIAAAAIRSGQNDGSLERLHYVDPSYVAQNAPLVVSEPGSTVHDATFWQPLALSHVAARGLAAVPAQIQDFTGAQWGSVRGFAVPRSAKARSGLFGAPPLGDPTRAAYKQAALDVIRSTAGKPKPAVDGGPLAWNLASDSLPRTGDATARLAHDVRLYLALNGALADAAIEAWDAKRTYQSPRPISMIRYLAFEGQSSDPKAPSYAADGLPLVPGLIELVTHASSAPGQRHAALAADIGQVAVLSGGRWILGTRWTPPTATPASPGWVAENSAFAYAAAEVLSALTGRSFAHPAAQASRGALLGGTVTPPDVVAGRAVGTAVGKQARTLAGRYAAGTIGR